MDMIKYVFVNFRSIPPSDLLVALGNIVPRGQPGSPGLGKGRVDSARSSRIAIDQATEFK